MALMPAGRTFFSRQFHTRHAIVRAAREDVYAADSATRQVLPFSIDRGQTTHLSAAIFIRIESGLR